MDVTVCVGTFGDEAWVELAQRAIASIPDDVPVRHVHGGTLCEARNQALALTETQHVCFLDADDQLEPGYFDFDPVAHVSVPWVRYISGSVEMQRRVPVSGHRHECQPECLADGNYIVIGAIVRTGLVRSVGGFRDFPLYEDWDLWARCWKAGATFAYCDSVYRAHVRPDSRNRGPSRAEKLAAHQAIARDNGLPIPA